MANTGLGKMIAQCTRIAYVVWRGLRLLTKWRKLASAMRQLLSPPQRLLFFKKPRIRGKGGKEGKAEKRERRKKRERKGKAKKASARFLSKYGKSCRYPTAHSLSAG